MVSYTRKARGFVLAATLAMLLVTAAPAAAAPAPGGGWVTSGMEWFGQWWSGFLDALPGSIWGTSEAPPADSEESSSEAPAPNVTSTDGDGQTSSGEAKVWPNLDPDG
jgi:ABC-type sugar transport system substrate-binding protein